MMFLPGLAVIFAGLLGGDGKLDAQVKTVVRELRVKPVSIPQSSVRKLTRHGGATRELVRSLNVEGVIACEVIKVRGSRSLRIVIYEGDGRLKAYSEIPIGRRGLTRSALAVLVSNLRADVTAMRESGAESEPARARSAKPKRVEPDPEPDPTIVIDDDGETPRAPSEPAPRRSLVADDDGENPLAPKTSPQTHRDVAAADAADSTEEVAALTAGASEPTPSTTAHTLRVGVAGGVGVASRSFRPAPSTVLPYSASPVPTLLVEARVQPARWLAVTLGAERTLQLTTAMGDGSAAPTTISRWEAAATYTVATLGALQLAPRLGAGRRSFAIESVLTERSPDSDYNYLIAGLEASAQLGARITLRARAAFEPVLSGAEPTGMALGDTSRWALEVGAGVEVRASEHLFVRASALYQRFHWSWDMAGEQAAGRAVDEYPSGALALGVDY